jgi:hypothetical protein
LLLVVLVVACSPRTLSYGVLGVIVFLALWYLVLLYYRRRQQGGDGNGASL